MRPYPGKHLTLQQQIFNYRLSRARRVAENAFGILVSRFRVFRRPLLVKPEVVDAVVKACTVLHNFLRKRLPEDVHFFTTESSNSNGETEEHQANGMISLRRTGTRYSDVAYAIRKKFETYFSSPVGAVPWQIDAVKRDH